MTNLVNKIDLSSILQLDVLIITTGTAIVMGGYLYYKGYFSNNKLNESGSTNESVTIIDNRIDDNSTITGGTPYNTANENLSSNNE